MVGFMPNAGAGMDPFLLAQMLASMGAAPGPEAASGLAGMMGPGGVAAGSMSRPDAGPTGNIGKLPPNASAPKQTGAGGGDVLEKALMALAAVQVPPDPSAGIAPIRPPAPIGPRGGGQNINPEFIQNIMQMLIGAGGGQGALPPTLGSLMGPRG